MVTDPITKPPTLTTKIITGTVMHKRYRPKVNHFTYGIYYLALPLDQLNDKRLQQSLAINRSSWLSFWEKDHGMRDDHHDLESWARSLLADYNLNNITSHIVLIAMPRVAGYVFNPVSFWLCLDEAKQLRAVICEVNNTFGETHSYICAHEDRRIIEPETWLSAVKHFHVSPFIKREGLYQFRFMLNQKQFGVWINYFDETGQKLLTTSLKGTFKPLTKAELRRTFWLYPLVTLKAIALIHWQALKLLIKGTKYISRPTQKPEKQTATKNLATLKSPKDDTHA